MSLSAIEKMRLQKDLKAVKAALSAATKPMEKIKLQKERKAIWARLKANASPDEKESQGTKAPKFKPIFDDENLPWGMNSQTNQIITNIAGMLGKDGWSGTMNRGGAYDSPSFFFEKENTSLLINGFSTSPAFNDEGKLTTDAKFSVSLQDKNTDLTLSSRTYSPKRGADATEIAKMVVEGVNRAANNEILRDENNHGLGLYQSVNINGVEYIIGGALFNDKTAFLYLPEQTKNLTRDLDGFEYLDKDGKPHSEKGIPMTFKELEAATGRPWGSKQYKSFSAAKKAVDDRLTRCVIYQAADVYHVVSVVEWETKRQNKNNKLVYVGPDAPSELNASIKSDSSDELAHLSVPLSKAIADIDSGFAEVEINRTANELQRTIEESTKGSAETNQGEDPILAQYRAGGFNGEDEKAFRQIIQKVYDAGLPANEVADGVVSWFEANPDKIAA